jgi:RNA polymerase sigma factor (sigma-70 family)
MQNGLKMSEEIDVTVWLNEIVSQPERATEQLWEAYYSQLVVHARKKLRNARKREFDEEDVASSAFQDFFEGAKKQRYPNLKDREGLIKLLLDITSKKANQQIRNALAQKRGGGEVRGESVFAKSTEESSGKLDGVVPTEAFGELFAEELLQKLDSLKDSNLRLIAIRKVEGYTNQEIADELGCAERTVIRKIGVIRSHWQEVQADETTAEN